MDRLEPDEFTFEFWNRDGTQRVERYDTTWKLLGDGTSTSGLSIRVTEGNRDDKRSRLVFITPDAADELAVRLMYYAKQVREQKGKIE